MDVLERMKSLAIGSLDELQARLADEPTKWSKRELMDLAELLLKHGAGGEKVTSGNAGAGGATVNVTFVQASDPTAGIVIENESPR